MLVIRVSVEVVSIQVISWLDFTLSRYHFSIVFWTPKLELFYCKFFLDIFVRCKRTLVKTFRCIWHRKIRRRRALLTEKKRS